MLPDCSTADAIKLIRNVAFKIEDAKRIEDYQLVNFYGIECGAYAYVIYKRLKDSESPILLDPWLIYNRTRDTDCDPDCPEFWNHGDMIVGLCQFLDFARIEDEGIYGEMQCTSCT